MPSSASDLSTLVTFYDNQFSLSSRLECIYILMKPLFKLVGEICNKAEKRDPLFLFFVRNVIHQRAGKILIFACYKQSLKSASLRKLVLVDSKGCNEKNYHSFLTFSVGLRKELCETNGLNQLCFLSSVITFHFQ